MTGGKSSISSRGWARPMHLYGGKSVLLNSYEDLSAYNLDKDYLGMHNVNDLSKYNLYV